MEEIQKLANLGQTDTTLAPTRIVMVGHVDHGKSTLVGRLLHETSSLPQGKVESIRESCRRRGVPFEWAFVMDAFSSERDQNITIDTAQIWLKHADRQFVIIDAPGHREFVKNMITGAAQADAAVVMLAADEGIQEQSRRHGYLLGLLGIKQVVVAVNKMDLIAEGRDTFAQLTEAYRAFLREVGIEEVTFVPVSAKHGDNVSTNQGKIAWYEGPSLLGAMSSFSSRASAAASPLRFAIQDVYRFDTRRIFAGRVESGTLSIGDELVFLPSGERARVSTIETWQAAPKRFATSGESIGITLDTQLFVERGTIAAHQHAAPVVSDRFQARVFWMGKRALTPGRVVKLKLATQEAVVRVGRVVRVVDGATLVEKRSVEITRNDVADVVFHCESPMVLDQIEAVAPLGRFVLVDGYDLAGGGIVHASRLARGDTEGAVRASEWFALNGHVGGILLVPQVLWHKRSQLQRALYERGVRAMPMADHIAGIEKLVDCGVVTIAPGQRAEILIDGQSFDIAASDVNACVAAVLPLLRSTGKWYPSI